MEQDQKVDGVVIGMLLGFRGARPLVVYAGNPRSAAIEARSTVALGPADIGTEVAILFEDAARDRPLVIGRLLREAGAAPDAPAAPGTEEETVLRLKADERIELRVGKAAIILEKDGHVTIRGTDIVSQAAGANSVRGGSVNIN